MFTSLVKRQARRRPTVQTDNCKGRLRTAEGEGLRRTSADFADVGTAHSDGRAVTGNMSFVACRHSGPSCEGGGPTDRLIVNHGVAWQNRWGSHISARLTIFCFSFPCVQHFQLKYV
jgi:hypothetical protein